MVSFGENALTDFAAPGCHAGTVALDPRTRIFIKFVRSGLIHIQDVTGRNTSASNVRCLQGRRVQE